MIVKILLLWGWLVCGALGFRQSLRKQSRQSERGGFLFFFIMFLWMFSALILQLSLYSYQEIPELTRSYENQTAYLRLYRRNQQLWLRTPEQEKALVTLPPENKGCQNLSWIDSETLLLILETKSGLFKLQEGKKK
jgi:hypothetical protein